jgi:hypothetical protein
VGVGQNFNDVWWSDLTVPSPALTWTPIATSGVPPAPRNGQSAVYDPATNRIVMFGGGLGFSSPCANDVWVLDHANGAGGDPTWVQLSPTGTPPAPRTWHNAVYDPNTNSMIVIGGQDCFSTTFGDAWVLSNANGFGGAPHWAQLSPTGNPGGRRAASAVYNPATNRLIVYGGATQSGAYPGDVWVLSNANGVGGTPTWFQLIPLGSVPPARGAHTAIYDLANNRMTIYGGGGLSGPNPRSDSWVLTNSDGTGGSPTWTEIGPLSNAPARSFASAVYDPVGNNMIIFGGNASSVSESFDDRISVLSNANGIR